MKKILFSLLFLLVTNCFTQEIVFEIPKFPNPQNELLSSISKNTITFNNYEGTLDSIFIKMDVLNNKMGMFTNEINLTKNYSELSDYKKSNYNTIKEKLGVKVINDYLDIDSVSITGKETFELYTIIPHYYPGITFKYKNGKMISYYYEGLFETESYEYNKKGFLEKAVIDESNSYLANTIRVAKYNKKGNISSFIRLYPYSSQVEIVNYSYEKEMIAKVEYIAVNLLVEENNINKKFKKDIKKVRKFIEKNPLKYNLMETQAINFTYNSSKQLIKIDKELNGVDKKRKISFGLKYQPDNSIVISKLIE